ncbi:MAG: CHAT domain-containing protein [Caldilineaceae bacterium]
MNLPPDYGDLEIRILERQEQGYPVELTLNNEREFPRGFLDPNWQSAQATTEPHVEGENLFAWLFHDPTLHEAWRTVRILYPYLRIRLRIDASAPEIHALPWEALRDHSEGHATVDLAAATSTPFSRYLAGSWQPGSPILKRPVKMLVAIATPSNLAAQGLGEFDADQEFAIIQQAVAGLDVELTRYPPARSGSSVQLRTREGEIVTVGSASTPACTLVGLAAELSKGYHILHVVAHGVYDERSRTAALVLANSNNQAELISDDAFVEMLVRQMSFATQPSAEPLRLVYLDACESATRATDDAWRGLAPKLVAAGVPAVVAMQSLIEVVTSQNFSQNFYSNLLQHGLVDLACNQARAMVMTANLNGAAIPALYMRLRNGRLLGQRGVVLGEQADSFWSTLLDNIASGECTPFLGPHLNGNLLPSPGELAQVLAVENNYPFDDATSLPRVAQFLGAIDNRRLRREWLRHCSEGFVRRLGLSTELIKGKRTLADLIVASDWLSRSRELFEQELHQQLADLNLPLYLTTNFDTLMEQALGAKLEQTVRSERVDWRAPLRMDAARPHFDLEQPATPTAPVVYHLFGREDDPLSMVLTEDDYLDYLARIARDYEYLLPTSIQQALASTTLLFLGYRMEDLELRVLLRGLLTKLDLERWSMLHVAVQLEMPSPDPKKQKEAEQFLQRYFSRAKIDVYWGSTQQFVAELHERWQEWQHG